MTDANFASYQNEIYARGVAGDRPPFTADLDALEESARAVLAPGPFWYVAGAAGVGTTKLANRAAFDEWRIVPRMLTKATERDLRTTVLGTDMAAPILAGPVGVQSILHPDGELATARATGELSVPMVMSSMASHSIEEVAQANGDGSRWFQLYWPNDHDVTVSIMDRARKAGFTVLVVTLDTPSLAWRPHDIDQAYLPMMRGVGTAIPFSDPVFLDKLGHSPADDLPAAVAYWANVFTNAGRSWDELQLLRERWDGPMVLKGIQHVDDAKLAVQYGMQGIIVSNHGGRQVDGAIGALEALPEITEAVGDSIEVLFDSGIRTGSDVLKALALGARAVLVARPYVYGLAHSGQAGVRHVLRSLLADFDLTMCMTGHRGLAELGRHSLRHR
ncbi:lactate 2-monooxygenase [Kibdelosporangium lantanae]